ncbi:MAG: hypothetical protein ABJC26_15270, partial [Gemmatimonadaceae bacterium]
MKLHSTYVHANVSNYVLTDVSKYVLTNASKCAAVCTALLFAANAANAQSTTAKPRVSNDSAAKIEGVRVTAERDRKPTLTKLTLPSTQAITANKVAETVNFVD